MGNGDAPAAMDLRALWEGVVEMSGLTVAAIQSNYLPWRGYFDIMHAADVFVLYDGVAYSKNTWRNRNRIVSPDGETMWLTVPVERAPLGTAICDVRVAEDGGRWGKKHASALRMAYGGTNGWADVRIALQGMYGYADGYWQSLSALNAWSVTRMAEALRCFPGDGPDGIVDDRAFGDLGALAGTARLLELLRRAGATRYITGPAGLNYFTREDFERAGIELVVWDYGGYPEYRQRWRDRAGLPFEGAVSAVDLLASVGAERAWWYVWGWRLGAEG